jgi:hypothetical protein
MYSWKAFLSRAAETKCWLRHAKQTEGTSLRLFDEIARTETRPRKEMEPTFPYWNLSARKPVDVLRGMVQVWFDSYPDEAKKDLRARFRSPIDSQHEAAFWELYLHELFTGIGYTLEVHPSVADSLNHPDFLVLDERPCFYLEATVAGLPSQEDAGAEARLREVFDLVNKLETPNFFLEVQHSGLPSTPPPARRLRKDLEDWLKTLDIEFIKGAWRDGGYDRVPAFQWSHDGLTLSFSPIPKSPSNSGGRIIAITAGDAHRLATDEDIRSAVERKAGKYGEPRLPTVIAVNYLGYHCDDFDINSALFGSEAVQVVRLQDGSYDWGSGHRLPNGVWFGKNGPRNRDVSAVIVGNLANPYGAGTTTPLLVHNPYLENPVNLSTYPLPQSVPDHATKTMRKIDGRSASKFLRLPSPWPPSYD